MLVVRVVCSVSYLCAIYLTLQIETHMKRLDEDLNSFAEDLKQGSNIVSGAV